MNIDYRLKILIIFENILLTTNDNYREALHRTEHDIIWIEKTYH
jgi:hypothetical protein